MSLLALQTAPLSLPRQPAVLLTAAAYALITAAIGIWASRRTRSAGDFFTAGRRLGPFALGVAAMASTLSGFTFIGGPGLLYSVGLGALLIFLPASLSNCLSAWVLAKRLRLLEKAEHMLNTEVPIVPIYHYVNVSLSRDNVENVKPNGRNITIFKHVWVNK